LRVQLHPILNNEYFADVALRHIRGYAHREDYHIGTSFMFYPIPQNDDFTKVFKPFLETGICFDLTRIIENEKPTNEVQHLDAKHKLNYSYGFCVRSVSAR
jgi:hypothetical protein